jgi:membrane fusion protein (multidrug efflux system)
MRLRPPWWLAAGLAGLVLVTAAATLTRTRGGAREATRAPGGVSPAPLVVLGHLKAADIPTTLFLAANIVSLRQADVYSTVAGYLETVTVRPGDQVRAGQIVAVVEHAQLDAQVAQAAEAAAASREGVRSAQATASAAGAAVENARAARRKADADLAAARAALEAADARLGVAQAAYARAQVLSGDGLLAQQDLDNARAQWQSAQAAVAEAEAQIRDAQAEIQQADAQVRAARAQATAADAQVQTRRAQTSSLEASLQSARLARLSALIRAPWTGIVVGRSLDPGAYVAPGGGIPILVIADLDRIAVGVGVPEADLPAIRKGAPAQIGVDAFPARVFRGAVSRIAGGVDPETRTLQVEIDVDNADHALRPGMYARVRLTGAPRRALTAPLAAVATVADQSYLWVVQHGIASRRAVTTGAAGAGVVEITGGVGPDEAIIVRGAEQVRAGAAVRVAPGGD